MVMDGGEAMETGLKVVSRKSFVQRFFSADYIDVPANAQILKLLSKQGDRQVLFADNVMKLNRSAKLVRRVLIITEVAMYILDSDFYRMRHRFALQAIKKLSLSESNDYFVAVHVPSEYDCLMASPRKQEIVTVLAEAAKSATASDDAIEVNLSKSFEYNMDAEHVREVHLEEVEGGVKSRFLDK
jgi:hypothetical protein